MDDDPSIRKLLNVLLTTEGHRVTEAQDGIIACDTFDADPTFDCVVLDVMMPRLDGYGVLRRLRQHRKNPEVAIIMLTAKGSKQDEAKAMVAGCDGYVTKPFDPDVLIGLIDVTLMFSPADRAASRSERREQWLPEIGEEWGNSGAGSR